MTPFPLQPPMEAASARAMLRARRTETSRWEMVALRADPILMARGPRRCRGPRSAGGGMRTMTPHCRRHRAMERDARCARGMRLHLRVALLVSRLPDGRSGAHLIFWFFACLLGLSSSCPVYTKFIHPL